MSFIGLGVALSVVFGCLLLALVAELCYLLLWKKRRTKTRIEIDQRSNEVVKWCPYGVCWESQTNNNNNNQGGVVGTELANKGLEQDLELGIQKDVLLKTFGDEGVESELMRLHNLAGPPRFLFTIKEETKEDLESEDGKSRGDRSRKGSRTRSLSDIMVAIDTPFLNPMASSSPMRCGLDNHNNNNNNLDSYKNQGFNPLFESSSSSVESEMNRFRSSPPPKFKFLRDAEEKLYRRLLMEEAQRKAQKNQGVVSETEVKESLNSTMVTEDKDKTLLRIINNKDRDQNQQIEIQQQQQLPQFPSSSSQVLPLTSSPTTLRPVDKASMVH